MPAADIAVHVVWHLLQQASHDIGPGGPVPSELRAIIDDIEGRKITPSDGLNRARAITTFGENEIYLREEHACSVAPVH